jgi:hypothetical protein
MSNMKYITQNTLKEYKKAIRQVLSCEDKDEIVLDFLVDLFRAM